MSETKTCKYCKTEIPKDAKICPNCRKKQKGPLGIIILVILVLVIIGAAVSGNDSSDSSSVSKSSETTTNNEVVKDEGTTEETTEAATEETIEYTQCTKQELTDALNANALKAADTYKDKYLEVSGNLASIDSDGSYITIENGEDDYSFVNVQCYIQNEEQKAAIMELNTGDAIVIKGKCTDVGEILGYSIDIDEIIIP